ncbi:S8 family serine peptidase [Hansschlegelia zhihuaiae]|uniref:Peptidase S8 n=1 Tax=Hansschlegelia zhihuaiae TaxID=405005 RepID=A0A4Q0MKW0_9HYPH|nr:S8 family serine peptidase [Hansschlegelia zhihuaiae]RXF73739.1 peptidase S8 [Hansschlegelia zhihuaiae]
MATRNLLALGGLAALATFALGGLDAAFAPGGTPGMLAAPAAADDDDDGGGRGWRGGGRFFDDDDDDRPRRRGPRFYVEDDDDDDVEVYYEPRWPTPRAQRRQAPPRRAAAPPEFVAAGVTQEALGRLRAAGFSIIAERRLGLLPEATVRVAAPRNLRAARARTRLTELAPGAVIGANVFYRPNARPACPERACFPYEPEHWSVPVCPARGPVGMIDTRVDPGHPALANRAIEAVSTRGEKRKPSDPAHGTEVAILLAGARAEPDDLKLVAVDAFHRVGSDDRADVFDLVAALDLLSERGVGVVNLSLAGPANEVLERAGQKAAERGMILVAAVGNEGPKAKPRYPAAYPWAVGVTAVDARGLPYAKAGRGEHVAFAAPGVRLELPDAALKPGRQRSGTSYASPLVAAALSSLKAQSNGRPATEIVAALAAGVEDKGEPGRDPVFGWGTLPQDKGCPAAVKGEAPAQAYSRE